MLKFLFESATVKFDKAGYIAAHQGLCLELLYDCAAEFVITVAQNVPIDTGMAYGTLTPVASHLKIKIQPRSSILRQYVPARGRKTNRNYDKSLSLGARQQSFSFTSGPVNYIFEFDTDVFHYFLNDLFSMNYSFGQLPTPWQSIVKGKKAFYATFYARKHLVKVPLRPFIKAL